MAVKFPQGYEHFDEQTKIWSFLTALKTAIEELEKSTADADIKPVLKNLEVRVAELESARRVQISLNSQLIDKTGINKEKTLEIAQNKPRMGLLALLFNLFRRK